MNTTIISLSKINLVGISGMYTHSQIYEQYIESNVPYMSFEEFINSKYVPVYDENLDFIGYELNDSEEVM